MSIINGRLQQLSLHGENGRILQFGNAAFAGSAATGELPVNMRLLDLLLLLPIPALASVVKPLSMQLGTVSATVSFTLIMPYAGKIKRWGFVDKDTIAASDTDYWSFGVVNKGQAGSGTTKIVDSSVAANTNKATSGSATTGYVKRDLTLSSTAADLVVAEGDVLEFTLTKAASAGNMTECSAMVELQCAPDEQLSTDEAFSEGFCTVPSTGTVTVNRSGPVQTANLKFTYLALGR